MLTVKLRDECKRDLNASRAPLVIERKILKKERCPRIVLVHVPP